jgi:ADP-ribose pyrophosphatase YjhB (NUDIX family)
LQPLIEQLKVQPSRLSMDILNKIKQIQALAETGIHYSHNDFELHRNKEISEYCMQILSGLTNTLVADLRFALEENHGYKTPKVDVRAVIFNEEHKILLVKEMVDGRWSLPGGWADIGYTPSEVAVKESAEEAGALVEPVRLLAVLDKKCHNHPPDIYYIYKIFIECRLLGWVDPDLKETSGHGFFGPDELPPLSTPRNTTEQIGKLFDFQSGILSTPLFD